MNILLLFFSLQFEIAPPTNIKPFDTSNDKGESITVSWTLSKDDSVLSGYEIWRSESQDTGYEYIGYVASGIVSYQDQKGIENQTNYYYRLRSKTEKEAFSPFAYSKESAIAFSQFFHTGKINVLIGLVIFISLLFYFINSAKRGKKLFIRKIAGLEALDEAVGRATEMGRPVLYVPGLTGMTDVATIASMNILGQVAKKTAEYDTPLIVPNYDPIVMTVAQEMVKEAYVEKGRPDAYKKENIFFLTQSQFAYAAGVDGIMLREKPATNLFMGMFFAESLILAETGNMTGAIQIAGTDAVAQLPFFITACDYTIIGEELYAASAYLSKEPLLLGSIKGQDMSKVVLLILIIGGAIFSLLGSNFIVNLLRLP